MAQPYTGVKEMKQMIRQLEIQLMSASPQEAPALREQIAALKKQIGVIAGISGAFN